MGLNIYVLKPSIFLGKTCPKDIDSEWAEIYSLDFAPIKHLTKFNTGFWTIEDNYDSHFSATYNGFWNFRKAICMAVYNMELEEFFMQVKNGSIDENVPFAEMLYFADNEGCFDYVVAEKLLKDFRSYAELFKSHDENFMWLYSQYANALELCSEIKGVVEYK